MQIIIETLSQYFFFENPNLISIRLLLSIFKITLDKRLEWQDIFQVFIPLKKERLLNAIT